ncbi:UvrD-helicase domain-containing protein [Radiobacillus sp. PE A8.2]|uniref:UvrD-helicase domain-containing protein n=1 Tax=Radiobacillus sp. PE A8.2 TaxID=3380349 RepID=UPI00388DDD96
MAEEGLTLETEVQEILRAIEKEQNFLLSGGAGSGKTYSLVSVIRHVLEKNPTKYVACMTYTNAAVKEIEDRVNHKNLKVSTIHDFLWDSIKHFQKELKAAIIKLSNDSESKISVGEDPVAENYFDNLEDGIQYKEYLRLNEGIFSHNELLIVSNYLFENYSKLNDIVKDKYQYIFVDEYQDTDKVVVNILLDHFKKSNKRSIIGFFGDAMQSIYPDGIGNLDEYKNNPSYSLIEIKKLKNRRNPQKVIDLANRLRTDGIKQEPSNDKNAPNIVGGEVKEGNVLFIHSVHGDVTAVKQYLSKHYYWNFMKSEETKELNLTHNLIAEKAGFGSLMDIYDKDLILKYRDRIKAYIKKEDIPYDFSESTFGEVIKFLKEVKTGKELKKVNPTDSMQMFINDNPELYEFASDYNYSNLCKIYVDKDQLIDDKKQDENDENRKGSKRDNLIKHLFKIQNIIYLYINGRFNEFLRITDYKDKITCIQNKRTLKINIERLTDTENKTIEEIINIAHDTGICIIDDKLEEFKEKNEYLYNRIKDVAFDEFKKLYDYLEGKTPFSTQHKTKGTEFDNVLVILDNGGWNNYNFENLFLNTGRESVLSRTQKIFYVCCTRAKENLAVFYHNPSKEVIYIAEEWFGRDNVICI